MKKKIAITAFMLILSLNASAASGNYTEVMEQLNEAEKSIEEMENAGIPTERVESLLKTANTSFRAQKKLAEEGGSPDFSRVTELTENVVELKQTSLRVNDRLIALENRINKLEDTNLNLTEVKKTYRKVNATFYNQRFKEAEKQVEDVYTEISEAQSVQTQVQAFASAQQENIVGLYNSAVDYTQQNWKLMSIGSILGLLIITTGVREINLWKLEKRREKRQGKLNVIEDMMEKAQHEYYVKGEGSEISFETRMEKFQEMRRDLNREINELETRIKSKRGLPVISPEIKDKSEELQAEGEVMEEAGEVKGSLERISKRREQEQNKNKDEDPKNSSDRDKQP